MQKYLQEEVKIIYLQCIPNPCCFNNVWKHKYTVHYQPPMEVGYDSWGDVVYNIPMVLPVVIDWYNNFHLIFKPMKVPQNFPCLHLPLGKFPIQHNWVCLYYHQSYHPHHFSPSNQIYFIEKLYKVKAYTFGITNLLNFFPIWYDLIWL